MNTKWIVTEDLLVTVMGDDGATPKREDGRLRLLVRAADLTRAAVLAIGDDGFITVNAEPVDLGDDTPAFWGIWDEADERGGLEMPDDTFFASPDVNYQYDPASHLENECRLGGCVGCETKSYRAKHRK